MYIIQNAIKNLVRNKGRNFLTTIIIFAIIVVAVIAIIINATTSTIIKDYKSRFGSQISIEIKQTSQSSIQNNIGNQLPQTKIPKVPTSAEVLDFGKSDYLKTAEYTTMKNGLIINTSSDNANEHDPNKRAFITGSSRDYINQEFKSGSKKIIDGEKYKNPYDCLISSAYASANDMSVGDEITIDLITYGDFSQVEQGKNPIETYERKTFTISGIYQDFSINNSQITNQMAEILVDFNTLINLESFDRNSEMEIFGTFFLKDSDMLDDFTKELRSKGLSDDMDVLTDEAGYKQVVGPVEGLANISITFMVVVLVLGCTILLILSVLTIRERKYEIGVLRAMGMNKVKTAAGLLIESIVITALCLLIGLGVGAAVSQPIADSLLSQQVQIAEESQNDSLGIIGINPDQENLSALSKINVDLNTQAVVQIILVALFIAGISSAVGILFITRYEPIRILSERN